MSRTLPSRQAGSKNTEGMAKALMGEIEIGLNIAAILNLEWTSGATCETVGPIAPVRGWGRKQVLSKQVHQHDTIRRKDETNRKFAGDFFAFAKQFAADTKSAWPRRSR